jgi:hypothetical protein
MAIERLGTAELITFSRVKIALSARESLTRVSFGLDGTRHGPIWAELSMP